MPTSDEDMIFAIAQDTLEEYSTSSTFLDAVETMVHGEGGYVKGMCSSKVKKTIKEQFDFRIVR